MIPGELLTDAGDVSNFDLFDLDLTILDEGVKRDFSGEVVADGRIEGSWRGDNGGEGRWSAARR